MSAEPCRAETVLIVGSGPDALRAREWPRNNIDSIVAINNAWQIREDWDYHIYPDDIDQDRLPKYIQDHQRTITSNLYVPAQNKFGGFVYAGGTMALTAAYWVLSELKPKVIAFVGCDMVYPKNKETHFYGEGTADPLRDDITLQSLEAKVNRFQITALENECICVNLSSLDESRLVFRKYDADIFFNELNRDKDAIFQDQYNRLKNQLDQPTNTEKLKVVKEKEKQLDYFVESGKYWLELDTLDAGKLKALDDLWLSLLLEH